MPSRADSAAKKGIPSSLSSSLAAHAIPDGDEAAGERRHEEIARSSRPDFKRDRDRLLHAKAFLHLDRKSELFLDAEGETAPTRLLYALETASTARILAELLHLNEEVTEAAVLARALGQPAFGRAGAEALGKLMAGHGGFDPVAQSLRIADDLEAKYPEFNGLNLSQAVRDSLRDGKNPSLEAQAAVWAARIAAACLDLEWGLEAGLLDEAQLGTCGVWREVAVPTDLRYTRLETGRRRNYNLRNLLSLLTEELARASVRSAEGGAPRIGFDREGPAGAGFEALERLVAEGVRRAPACEAAYRDRAACLAELFAIYAHRPHLLGETHVFRLKKDGVHRVAADFLAQRGDRELLRLRRELVGDAAPSRDAAAGKPEQSLLL